MTARAMSCCVDDALRCMTCDARCVEPFCSERCKQAYEARLDGGNAHLPERQMTLA